MSGELRVTDSVEQLHTAHPARGMDALSAPPCASLCISLAQKLGTAGF
eukprot:COSAG03_NODE_9645_length_703_cov_1.600993_1_plen_47_part_01